jgi:peptidoglycan hydrolase-like protein with peptidoglycan-binding domain
LAQLCLGRDGTYYVVAAGRCNHAGAGNWQGITSGNTNFIGIEAENAGTPDDPWPEVQLDAYRRGVAAILKRLGLKAIMCAGHKEYAPNRKPDPHFDMNEFRATVAAFMNSTAPPALIPGTETPDHPKKGAAPRPTLRRGSSGDMVKQVQEKVGVVHTDGVFGSKTEAAVRDFQRARGMVPDGIVGPNTWAILDQPEPMIGNPLGEIIGTPVPSPTSPKAGKHVLGDLSAKYETGGRGPGTVSTGRGDAGGVSYGSYQMTSKGGGTVKRFVTEKDFPWLNKFAGLTPGSDDFSRQWKKIASEDPERFQAVQHEFIKQTHFDPLAAKVKIECGLDLTTRPGAVQDVIWSTAVQQGPNTSVIDRALKNLKSDGIDSSSLNFDERLIKAIYDERGRKLPNGDLAYFSRNSKEVQKGVANRFVHEKSDALQMLANES